MRCQFHNSTHSIQWISFTICTILNPKLVATTPIFDRLCIKVVSSPTSISPFDSFQLSLSEMGRRQGCTGRSFQATGRGKGKSLQGGAKNFKIEPLMRLTVLLYYFYYCIICITFITCISVLLYYLYYCIILLYNLYNLFYFVLLYI